VTVLQAASGFAVDPFEAGLIGTVTGVSATTVRIELAMHSASDDGDGSAVTCVGDLVVIDAIRAAIVGRVTSLHADHDGASATAEVKLLTSVDLVQSHVIPGIAAYPSLGGRVYGSNPLLVKWMTERGDGKADNGGLMLEIGSLEDGTPVGITPERLFGRHCAVVGTTGGGKSWSLARLVESAAMHPAKLILLDPTGEFHTLDGARHVALGGSDRPESCVTAVFPYRELFESDLLALFRPETNVQLARLRAAIKSLKLAAAVGMENPLVAGNGCIPKAQQLKRPFDDAYAENIDILDGPLATFDVELLAMQMRFECVYPSAGPSPNERVRWGDPSEPDLSECDPLIARIESNLNSPEFSCIFASQEGGDTLPGIIREFLASDERVLRISLRQLSFRESIREIVANAIGRHLLELGRTGAFEQRPVVVLVDEAHHFLNNHIGDAHWTYSLDSFELIAKEGRKYSLTSCLATQRPRDIPEGVLSQMGTFVVHRLINDDDRSVVERASGEIDREAADFLPTLGPGHAVVIGVELPMPLTLQILRPDSPPDSRGPDFQAYWRR
jgi:hypothetical protein